MHGQKTIKLGNKSVSQNNVLKPGEQENCQNLSAFAIILSQLCKRKQSLCTRICFLMKEKGNASCEDERRKELVLGLVQ
jgi:hypothetical protein